MIAAIYARKSTEQNGVDDQEKSVTRQIEHAKAYAANKGWRVAADHIYVDDGISGAEFSKRPGFLRLMNALKPQPPFQVLVMSEESRLGREAIETAYAMKQLISAGVQVWFYLEDRQRTLESPTDKLLLSVTTFADELEREKARQRTYDAMVRKAKALHVTGGRVFGYDNVEVPCDAPSPDGRVKRAHVVRRINEAEAAMVIHIFQLCAAGKGFASIAKQLNEEGVTPPRSNPGRIQGWAPSCVREIIHRELYIGQVVWNKSKKRDAWGRKRQRPRPESEWMRFEAPELRIISDELWKAAHERLAATRATYLRRTGGQLFGRPATGMDAKYLLTGMATCGCCGGSLHMRSGGKGAQRSWFYGCSSYHLRGKTICTNNVMLPRMATDRAVLSTIEQDLLQPEVVEQAITLAVDQFRQGEDDREAKRKALTQELKSVGDELTRLSNAIAAGAEVSSLLDAIKQREQRRTALQDELATLIANEPIVQVDLPQIQGELHKRLDDWRGLLTRHIAQARQILRKLLVGRLTFTPKEDANGKYYEFSGQGTLGRLLEGIAFPKGRDSGGGYARWWHRRWDS